MRPYLEDSREGPSANMGANGPRISIVVPSLNQGRFIEATLRSVLDQGYPDLELIVVDGGSRDETVEVIGRHQADLAWWISEPDEGQSDAIAKGMARATGELVNWLNADDVLLPGSLDAIAAADAEHRDRPTVFVGGAQILDHEGNVRSTSWPQTDLQPILPRAPLVTGGVQASWFLTRSAWEITGGVDPTLHFAMDIDLYLRAAASGVDFVPLQALVAGYRDHPETKTAGAWRSSISEKSAVYRRALAELPRADRHRYRTRVRRQLASLYLNGSRPEMTLSTRARRVGRAVLLCPQLLTRRNRCLRLWHVLAHGTATGPPGLQ